MSIEAEDVVVIPHQEVTIPRQVLIDRQLHTQKHIHIHQAIEDIITEGIPTLQLTYTLFPDQL